MGCRNSKPHLLPSSRPQGSRSHNFTTDATLAHSEKASRIESIPKSREAVFGGLKVRYAYVTQRGYYPDGTNDAFATLLP